MKKLQTQEKMHWQLEKTPSFELQIMASESKYHL